MATPIACDGSAWTVHHPDLNAVQNVNVVHLALVPDDRRARARAAKRQRILDAAGRVIDREGLAGLTARAVADELDCAVGTIYRYLPSKAALVVALQDQAVAALLGSYRTARATWDAALAEEGLGLATTALVQVEAFGRFLSAAAVVLADEVHLQRLLLSERPPTAAGRGVAGVAGSGAAPGAGEDVGAVVARWTELPTALLAGAAAVGAIGAGDAEDRAVRWLAALNGVLLLDNLAPVDRHRFRAPHHARRLTAELVVGWGAEPDEVEVASSHVDRLAARGPMAPPPEGPGFD